MIDTPSLFDLPRSRHSDPRTSKAAAARVASVSPGLEAQICGLLGRYAALTKDEICQLLAIETRRWPTIASLLTRMKKSGKLEWRGDTFDGQNLWRLRVDDVNTGGRL